MGIPGGAPRARRTLPGPGGGGAKQLRPPRARAKQRIDRGKIGTPETLIITSRDPGAPPADCIRQSGGIFRNMLIHDAAARLQLLEEVLL